MFGLIIWLWVIAFVVILRLTGYEWLFGIFLVGIMAIDVINTRRSLRKHRRK